MKQSKVQMVSSGIVAELMADGTKMFSSGHEPGDSVSVRLQQDEAGT